MVVVLVDYNNPDLALIVFAKLQPFLYTVPPFSGAQMQLDK